jgi:hypothetical protein
VNEKDCGVWLAYTFAWRRMAAFADEFDAISDVSGLRDGDH